MAEDTSEFYQPRETIKILSDPHSENQQSRSPFVKSDIVATTINPSEESDTPQTYAIVSPEHGRAIIDTRINNKVIWGGNLPGDIYGAKDWKGANMDRIRIEGDEYSPYGFRVWGLKDSTGIDRIEKASHLLRSDGLPTENPTRIVKILEVLEYGKKIPIQEWKSEYLQALESSATTLEKVGNEEAANRERGVIAKMKIYFDNVDFFIEERDLQVAERIRDLELIKNDVSFKTVMNPILKWVNQVFETKKSGIIANTETPEKFILEPEDIQRYFGKWLPEQMGIYMAHMHKIGIAHGFTHAQNWSIVGTLYDLDSVHGQPLGDIEATESEFALDTRVAIGAISELLDPITSNYLSSNFPDLAGKAQTTIILAYLKERFGHQIDQEKLQEIKNTYFPYMENRGKNIPLKHGVWDEAVKQLV